MAPSGDNLPKPEIDSARNDINNEEGDMSLEVLRLSSFKKIPSQQYENVCPSKLSKAGLYYDSKTNETLCFTCSFRKVLSYWKEETCPMLLHKHECPECNFVTRNVIPDAINSHSESNFREKENLITEAKASTTRLKQQTEHLNFSDSKTEAGKKLCCSSFDQDEIARTVANTAIAAETIPVSSNSSMKSVGANKKLSTNTKTSIPTADVVGASAAQTDHFILPSEAQKLSFSQPLPQQSNSDKTLKKMRYEEARLMSFLGWQKHNVASPEDLAKAGFFYLGDSDKTRCAFCDMILCQWELGDDPMFEHRRQSPRCKFVLGIEITNIPMHPTQRQKVKNYFVASSSSLQCLSHAVNQNHQTNVNLPWYPEYANETTRLLTFEKWPHEHPAKEVLCAAGLFYTGYGDNVRCFFCSIGLKNWWKDDDPVELHMTHNNACSFIRKIHEQQSWPQSTLPQAYLYPFTFDSDKVVRALLDMGFDAEIINKTRRKHYFDKEIDFTSAEEWLEAIFEEIENNTSKDESENEMHLHENSDTDGKCILCLDGDKNIVFLPCGHVATCLKCAKKIKDCCMCRTKIQSFTKIHIVT